MAHNSNDAGTSADCSCPPHRPTPQFKPFEWIEASGLDPSQHHLAALLNDSRDVVQGAQTLIQLLDWDEDRRDSAVTPEDPAPLFSANHRASLLRLLSASLGLLHARIEAQCDGMTGSS